LHKRLAPDAAPTADILLSEAPDEEGVGGQLQIAIELRIENILAGVAICP
jgi:hypothetical protein